MSAHRMGPHEYFWSYALRFDLRDATRGEQEAVRVCFLAQRLELAGFTDRHIEAVPSHGTSTSGGNVPSDPLDALRAATASLEQSGEAWRHEILEAHHLGYSNRAIAQAAGVSYETVRAIVRALIASNSR